jgi:hypothetical protein
MEGHFIVPMIRYQRFGSTLALVCGKRDPSNDEWTVWCDFYATAVEQHGVRRLFVVSASGGPNARQRKQIVATLVQRVARVVDEISTAACGNSPAVRIVTAAFGWMSGVRRIKTFRGEDRDRALAYLGVPEEQRPEILAAVERLEAELAGTASQVSREDAR